MINWLNSSFNSSSLNHFVVKPLEFHQFIMGSLLSYFTINHDVNSVHISDGRESMGYCNSVDFLKLLILHLLCTQVHDFPAFSKACWTTWRKNSTFQKLHGLGQWICRGVLMKYLCWNNSRSNTPYNTSHRLHFAINPSCQNHSPFQLVCLSWRWLHLREELLAFEWPPER